MQPTRCSAQGSADLPPPNTGFEYMRMQMSPYRRNLRTLWCTHTGRSPSYPERPVKPSGFTRPSPPRPFIILPLLLLLLVLCSQIAFSCDRNPPTPTPPSFHPHLSSPPLLHLPPSLQACDAIQPASQPANQCPRRGLILFFFWGGFFIFLFISSLRGLGLEGDLFWHF